MTAPAPTGAVLFFRSGQVIAALPNLHWPTGAQKRHPRGLELFLANQKLRRKTKGCDQDISLQLEPAQPDRNSIGIWRLDSCKSANSSHGTSHEQLNVLRICETVTMLRPAEIGLCETQNQANFCQVSRYGSKGSGFESLPVR